MYPKFGSVPNCHPVYSSLRTILADTRAPPFLWRWSFWVAWISPEGQLYQVRYSNVALDYNWILFLQRLMLMIFKTLLTLLLLVLLPENQEKVRAHLRSSGSVGNFPIDGKLIFLWTFKCHIFSLRIWWLFLVLESRKCVWFPVLLVFMLHDDFSSMAFNQISSYMSLTRIIIRNFAAVPSDLC